MYPAPFGTYLTSEQARELDDIFLAPDPYEYFRGRIAGLLSWAENAPRKGFEQRLPDDLPGSSSLRAEFTRYLRRPVADTHFAGIDVDAQMAVDALAVRHHAAEALVRLACARLAPDTTAGPCLWAAIANGAFAIGDVITLLSKSARKPHPEDHFIRFVLPPGERDHARERRPVVVREDAPSLGPRPAQLQERVLTAARTLSTPIVPARA